MQPGMCNQDEHYHIIIPPAHEDLEEEKNLPIPPPLSPHCLASDSNPSEENEDQKVGGLLLSQMEDTPMTRMKAPKVEINVERLFSENGVSALYKRLGDIHLKGQGHETEDLQTLVECYGSWAQKCFPEHVFEELVTQLEEVCLEDVQLAENGAPLCEARANTKDSAEPSAYPR